MSMKLPLRDGQVFRNRRGSTETVGGEIKPPHREPVCWTLQGNWYRRRDGEEMTGAGGSVMTAHRFFRLRAKGKA